MSESESEQQPLLFNGIDATSGGYISSTSDAQLAAIARGVRLEQTEREHVQELAECHLSKGNYGVDADTRNLAETGWGVLFAHDADPRIREALAPLLDLRRAQATARDARLYRELTGREAYRPGESKQAFLSRIDAPTYGPVEPEKLPYYLLIVGDPETIPYGFQYQLDVQYAVGRIAFDTLEEYAHYARSVVLAETSMPPLPRRACFFGVRNDDDLATISSADHLISPLAQEALPTTFANRIEAEQAKAKADIARHRAPGEVTRRALEVIQACKGWKLDMLLADQADKASLRRVLGGADTPALLFSASHGMSFPSSHKRQLSDQGALLCQDWPGPRRHQGAIPPEYYFAGADVDDHAGLAGLLAFFFACYGGGTPRYDEFAQATQQQRAIAPHAFLAHLPRRLLGHPNGGALAVVGHVERAWGYSFLWQQRRQLQVFENMLTYLMLDGQPIGAAIDWLNARYAEIATALNAAIHPAPGDQPGSDQEVARLWTTNNDARSYLILGDPAVRLNVAADEHARPRSSGIATTPLAAGPISTPVASTRPAPVAAPVSGRRAAAAAPDEPPAASQPMQQQAVAVPQVAPQSLAGSMLALAEKAGRMLQQAMADATSLHVVSYVSDDLQQVRYDVQTRTLSGRLRLRAMTRISLDGDTVVCLPAEDSEENGEIDMALWQLHNEMVAQAREQRREMLALALSAARRLPR